MKATLVRLDDYEEVYPNRFSDLVNFSKAMAYERLRDYEQAVNYYRKVAASNGRLGEQAEKNIVVLTAFKEILREPLPTQDPFGNNSLPVHSLSASHRPWPMRG